MSDDEDTRYELHIPADLLSQWFAEAEDYVVGDAEERAATLLALSKAGYRYREGQRGFRRKEES